jgi:hypothetical protein
VKGWFVVDDGIGHSLIAPSVFKRFSKATLLARSVSSGYDERETHRHASAKAKNGQRKYFRCGDCWRRA